MISEEKLNQKLEDFAASYNESRNSLNMLVKKRPPKDGD